MSPDSKLIDTLEILREQLIKSIELIESTEKVEELYYKIQLVENIIKRKKERD